MADWRIHEGDCRDVLRTMPAQSVHTVVTSPPYFGLRDYGTGEWEGGDPACDHLAPPGGGTTATGLQRDGRSEAARQGNAQRVVEDRRQQYRVTCGKCGARRTDRQIGLEPTPDEFVAALVEVFREVRRVLRDDGTVWLNLGDSYSGGGGFSPDSPSNVNGSKQTTQRSREYKGRTPADGCKPKDLIGVPWMVAFALRADGWYLRSDIIWSKPNPMPESVTDRPTKAHEYVFLLSKGPRYHYDADAIREPVAPSQVGRVRADPIGGKSWQERQQHSAGSVYRTGSAARLADVDGQQVGLPGDAGEGAAAELVGDELADGFEAPLGVLGVGSTDLNGEDDIGGEAGEGLSAHAGSIQPVASNAGGRNKRSVWEVATQPFPGAHFATFPPKLIEPCILAGAPERCCGECGAPWVRVVERQNGKSWHDHSNDDGIGQRQVKMGQASWDAHIPPRTVGFEPSCQHYKWSCSTCGEVAGYLNGTTNERLCMRHVEPVLCEPEGSTSPGVVLDPFAGAGTTGLVALQHGREFVGIELNPAYAAMARERIETAVRLGFRSPQNGQAQIDGQLDIFGAMP